MMHSYFYNVSIYIYVKMKISSEFKNCRVFINTDI